jgi:hypothetical protein
VKHKITAQKHEMHFVLVRNAIGTPPAPASGVSL